MVELSLSEKCVFAMSSDDTVRLVRSGHDAVDILVHQVTPATVARVFSLDPTTVWLKEEYGQRAFFPDSTNSQFEFPADTSQLDLLRLVVEGSSQSRQPSMPFSTPLPSPSFSQRPVIPIAKKGQGSSVKIVQASFKRLHNGKAEFNQLGQLFIDISETTANVHYISSVIKKQWGANYVLVTSDGLPIEDSSGTQGFKFWRVGSRKIFAVSEGDLKASKGKQKRPVQYVISDSDSSEEDFQPPRKKMTPATSAEVRQVSKEVKQVQQQIESFFQITTSMRVPPGLHKLLLESFKCHICHVSPIEPPVIFARCCRRILGCQVCADTWYRQDDNMARTCPMCRAERAYSDTTTLRGLDDLLKGLGPILGREPPAEQPQQPRDIDGNESP